ncbi:MAG: GH3 auxin-responsive promoter family protein [Promethearchaeota archaeon]
MSRESLVKLFYEQTCRPALKRLEDPAAAQENCLRKILRRNKGTVYGKQYGFADIKSIEDFQHRVPLTDYDSMDSYISRCKQGEQNVLFPDKILYFLATAGTTGTSKVYPLGWQRVEEVILEGTLMGAFFLVHTGCYEVMDGSVLTLAAPPSTGEKFGEYDVAYFSGAISNLPLPPRLQRYQEAIAGLGSRRVPPREVDRVLDWGEKFYQTARHAVAADIRFTSAVTANMVALLLKIHSEYYDRLLADPELGNGTKNELRRISQDGIIDLRKLWPNFCVFGSGGMSVTQHRRIIKDLLGDCHIWESYSATEASIGIQVYPDKGIFPLVDFTFLEFIPEEEKDAEPVPLRDVKLHTPYRVIVTNNGGFYRFDIGDFVTFSALDPPVFGDISRRTALVNVVGERVSEEMLLRALEEACEQQGLTFVDFSLFPEVTAAVIRYHLFVEFTQPPDDIDEFVSVVDTHLRSNGLYYNSQRQNGVLSPPILIPVKPGGFEAVLQQLGKVPGQGKVPRLLSLELSRMIPRLKPVK